MCERPATVAIAERPNTGCVGAQLVVHLNMAMRICGDTGLVQAKIVRVRPPTNCYQQMSSNDL